MQWLSGKLATLNTFFSKVAERASSCLDTLKKCANKKDFHWTKKVEEAFQAMKKLIAELPTLTAPKKEEELMEVEPKAYGIKYMPRSAIKGQVLADFLADTMAEDNHAQAKTDGQDDALTKGEGPKEQE
ncbi:hypothetical protein Tco_1431856, partial [Tanacetum coccineum]